MYNFFTDKLAKSLTKTFFGVKSKESDTDENLLWDNYEDPGLKPQVTTADTKLEPFRLKIEI